jgi:DNA-binding NtrC family response regulator
MVEGEHGATRPHPSLASGREEAVPKLVVLKGPSQGRAFAMQKHLATVGRHQTNDLCVDDPHVSGVHLELSRLPNGAVLVRDAQTTNGTWLGAHRVQEITITPGAPGAELQVGDSVILFERDVAEEAPHSKNQDSFGELVGVSTVMRELFGTLARIAKKDLGVLIHGETGTGKEEVARALHKGSTRAASPFIVIDATSLPDTLAESLLFGHEKGAFTGATERSAGFFEAAHKGTVFIDEVGELPKALQPKFLRVLERREVIRVGGHIPIPIDVRVIAASNRDLRTEVDKGNFRDDLFFRLAQVHVTIPALRDHLEDVPVLCRKLLMTANVEAMIEAEALAHLAAQRWPGNVRELRNVLLRAAAFAQDGIVRRADLAGEGHGFRGTAAERGALDLTGTFATAKERAVERFEHAYLSAVLRRSAGNLSKAARDADLARHYFRELLKKRGLYGVALEDETP